MADIFTKVNRRMVWLAAALVAAKCLAGNYTEQSLILSSRGGPRSDGDDVRLPLRDLLTAEVRGDWKRYKELWHPESQGWADGFLAARRPSDLLPEQNGSNWVYHFLLDASSHSSDAQVASVRVLVLATPPVAEFSQFWEKEVSLKNVRCRFYGLERRDGTWKFTHVSPSVNVKSDVLSSEFAEPDFYFANEQKLAVGPDRNGAPQVLPQRLAELITPRSMGDLRWGEDIHIWTSGIKILSHEDKVDLSDPTNAIFSYVSASRAGDLDWLMSLKDQQDQRAMQEFTQKPELLSALKKITVEQAKSFEIFAIAKNRLPDNMFIVALACKAPGDAQGGLGLGLTTVPFRLVSGRWLACEEQNRALVGVFNRASRGPFLLWQSERAMRALKDTPGQ